MMGVQFDPSRLRRLKWHEYAVRFAFGGLIAGLAGFLAKTYGPAVGGLFLGFPAILPASLTLVKKHDGEEAAGNDALGAIAGSGGMIAFALIVWGLATHLPAWLVLIGAFVAWLALSIVLWLPLRRFAGHLSPADRQEQGQEQERPATEREQGGAHPARGL